MIPEKRPCVLVFAGSDPSGGAGIQADIEAISAHGAHALPVITALTVQDNDRVFSVHPVPAQLLQQQATALVNKMEVAAVKIGIVGNRANAEAIVDIIKMLRARQPDLPVVVDTVLASGHGDALAVDNAIDVLMPLMAVASLITPNLPESSVLCKGERRLDAQVDYLLNICPNILIKGGHGTDSGTVTNRWSSRSASRSWTWPRIAGSFHGTGCTLASAIAALLAHRHAMADAIDIAQGYCHQTLENAYAIAEGQRIPGRALSLPEESK